MKGERSVAAKEIQDSLSPNIDERVVEGKAKNIIQCTSTLAT